MTQDGGFVMFMSINDMFKDFARDNYELLQDSDILVISRDIVGNGSVENDLPFDDTSSSRYDNISFIPELVPNASVMEYSHGSTRELFYQSYMEQLTTKNAIKYLCCIVDTVVNEGTKVFLLCSQTEYLLEYMEVLKDFLETRFRFNIYSYIDFQHDNQCIYNIGNVKDIKNCLKVQLLENDLIDDVTNEFLNSLTDNMIDVYRKTLLQKTVDELDRLATKKGIYVNRHKPKEVIVDHIISGLVKQH